MTRQLERAKLAARTSPVKAGAALRGAALMAKIKEAVRMTKKEMEMLAEFLEEKSEVFGYYLEEYRVNRKPTDALAKSEVAMATVYEISKAMGIDNSYMIKETGIKKGKEIYHNAE